MPAIQQFTVTPNLPEPLQPLLKVANNIWWSWNVEAISLLRRVDPNLWDQHSGNPIAAVFQLMSHVGAHGYVNQRQHRQILNPGIRLKLSMANNPGVALHIHRPIGTLFFFKIDR